MHILIRWTYKYRQTGWSIGFCSSCKQPGPARVDDVIEVVSINLLPISRSIIGKIQRCDFCERPVDSVATKRSVDVGEWSHDQGQTALAELVAPAWKGKVSARASQQRLISLLSAAQARSTMNNVDVVPGLTVGLLVGIAIAVFAVMKMASAREPQPAGVAPPVRVQEALWILGPPLIGLILGGFVNVLHAARRIPLQMIEAACRGYEVDYRELRELAPHYAARVRRAVESVLADAAFERHNDAG